MAKSLGIDDTIDDIIRWAPAAAAVVLQHRMACVDCAIAPFHTIADVCAEYELDPAVVLEELRAAANADPAS